MSKTNVTRLCLMARAWSRLCGGYSFWGQWRGVMRCVWIVSISWTALVAVPRLFQLSRQGGCRSVGCTLTAEDLQVLLALSIPLAAGLLITELLIKPWARSMPISDELRSLAANGMSEAALALAELYADRGAEDQARLWMAKAADLGHRIAIKQLKRYKL
ncbi:hypothetical protein K4F85_04160 [Phaeobacter inhibens]|uniref:hypothetical protein n=1 Tax=Phaeobacter inhibens TaxID=221822 RepID=UPI0021A43DB1|nr:hypothetical protein [Phaeobacter inhibens]UWR42092.1 hypothetical protein K4F85_04160 [Phaeobacter inhibens]